MLGCEMLKSHWKLQKFWVNNREGELKQFRTDFRASAGQFVRFILSPLSNNAWCWETPMMSSSLLLLWETDVTSVPHNHHDRMMRLFAVWKFGGKKTASIVVFSQCNICNLCENAHTNPIGSPRNIFPRANYLHEKKLIRSVKGPKAPSSHNVFGHSVVGYRAHRLIHSADSDEGDKFSVGRPANWVRWQFVVRLPVSCYFPVCQAGLSWFPVLESRSKQ